MGGKADLFDAALAPVVPEHPAAALLVIDGEGLVAGIAVPGVVGGEEDRIGRMPLPVGDSVLGSRQADLGAVLVAKSNVEHEVRACGGNHLASSHLVLFPRAGRIGGKHRIVSEHVGRLGVKQVWTLLSQQPALQTHFGTASPTDAARFARERLERIMDKRNTIIHRAKGFAAPSEADTRECAMFFTGLTEALAHVLVDYVASL